MTPRIKLEDSGWLDARLSPIFIMTKRVGSKHGQMIMKSLEALGDVDPPIYAIKRKGKTGKMVRDKLDDTILHHSMYMFFYDEHDIVMAKLALGSNIAHEYDLRPFH